jgi:hypothetical protein
MKIVAPVASQSFQAVWAMTSKTGCTSFGEREITFNTLAIAAWYSRLSASSADIASACRRDRRSSQRNSSGVIKFKSGEEGVILAAHGHYH